MSPSTVPTTSHTLPPPFIPQMESRLYEDGGQQRKITSTLNFYNHLFNPNPRGTREETENQPVERRPYVAAHIDITDVTGREHEFKLDKQGFQWMKHETRVKDLEIFRTEQKIKKHYYPESEQFLMDVTGAQRAIIIEHRVRGLPNDRGYFVPEPGVHVDISYDGAELDLKRVFPDEADELLKHRYQTINMWRPLGAPVLQHPLAVADDRSVAEEDLIAFPILKDNVRTAEFFTVKNNPAQRWFYKHRMNTDEVLLMKQFDSDTSVARRVIHGAFVDPSADVGKDWNRRSIECVTMLFYDD